MTGFISIMFEAASPFSLCVVPSRASAHIILCSFLPYLLYFLIKAIYAVKIPTIEKNSFK